MTTDRLRSTSYSRKDLTVQFNNITGIPLKHVILDNNWIMHVGILWKLRERIHQHQIKQFYLTISGCYINRESLWIIRLVLQDVKLKVYWSLPKIGNLPKIGQYFVSFFKKLLNFHSKLSKSLFQRLWW